MVKKTGDRRIAVIGFGSQGEAQAQLLQRAGFDVTVGLRAGSRSRARARRLGFRVALPRVAAARGAVVAMLVPDRHGRRLLVRLAPQMRPDALVVFAAGYPLVFGRPALPTGRDIVLVAPHGPGRDLKSGVVLSGFVGVAHDATGRAAARARRYAGVLGLAPLYDTTPRDEALGDIFGEQALLCGGLLGLTAAVAGQMLERGLSPANAYFETIAQLDRLAELLRRAGVQGFWREISDCAAAGTAEAAPRLFDADFRRKLEATWKRIESGRFARSFHSRGRPRALPEALRVLERLERAGKKRGRP